MAASFHKRLARMQARRTADALAAVRPSTVRAALRESVEGGAPVALGALDAVRAVACAASEVNPRAAHATMRACDAALRTLCNRK